MESCQLPHFMNTFKNATFVNMVNSRAFFHLSLCVLFHGMSFLKAQQSSYNEKIYGVEFELPMVYVKGGDFVMGSKKTEVGHFGDEGPQHGVALNAFWMSQVEITWDLYNLFVSREIDQYQIKKDETSEVSVDVDAVSGATTPYV